MVVTEHDYELLSSLIQQGLVWWSQTEHQWIGRAADSKEVGLGSVKDQVAQYLHFHPTPDTW